MSQETLLVVLFVLLFSPVGFGFLVALYFTFASTNLSGKVDYHVVHENNLCYVYEILPTGERELIGICGKGKTEKHDIERLVDKNEEMKGKI